MDADWYAFCQAIYEGIEGKEWEELYSHHREMSNAAGAEKPSESQKAKALWTMKAAKDRRRNSTIQLAKQHPAKETDKTRAVGKSITRTQSQPRTKL